MLVLVGIVYSPWYLVYVVIREQMRPRDSRTPSCQVGGMSSSERRLCSLGCKITSRRALVAERWQSKSNYK
jgi:hypothetical protein